VERRKRRRRHPFRTLWVVEAAAARQKLGGEVLWTAR